MHSQVCMAGVTSGHIIESAILISGFNIRGTRHKNIFDKINKEACNNMQYPAKPVYNMKLANN